jgi:hypothetical protein
MPERSSYFDGYGLSEPEHSLMDLVYGPGRLSAPLAGAALGLSETEVESLLKTALRRIGRVLP